MTSKERLLKCIAHEQVDKVPISMHELNGWNPDSWENLQPSYQKLMNAIREYTDCMFLLDPTAVHSKSFDPRVETTHWREEKKHFTKRVAHAPGKSLEALFCSEDGINTTWTLEPLLKDISDIDEYLGLPYETPQPDMPGYLRVKEELGDRGVMLLSVSDPIAEAASLFGMANFLVLAITEPDRMKYFMDALHERQLDYIKRILSYDVRDIIIRVYGPEYATPPYLSLGYFRLYVACYLKQLCALIRDAGAIPRIHCHGRIATVLDEFAETQAMALDPLELPPDGDITLAEVKRRYGRRFCLMGGMELKDLELCSRAQIDTLVREAMDASRVSSAATHMVDAAWRWMGIVPKADAEETSNADR
jgi:uroporphyrinogen-III decarboxylase